ncbi:MAG: Fic family protein [Gammaproteobacteria bacterium]|nr:Fic family protein [Gammaproteobacteria bacterium]
MAANKVNTALMEPLIIPESDSHRGPLMDLVLELVAKSARFKSALPLAIQSSLASSVRAMNCYYSNLIEGHNTHPIDIERALQGNYDMDPKKRDLQLEAKSHIEVQKWIDAGGLNSNPFSMHAICEIHKRFCEHLPEDLLWVKDSEHTKKLKLIPGQLRKYHVKVGNHVPVQPDVIPDFLMRFEKVYSNLSKADVILALAASHHRLLWIHPFLDGNGRVARLMSHAVTLNVLESGGIWSISRGLARNADAYKEHLANCDLKRRNNLDGRGPLSLESLVAYTKFFLEICIDQISFMEKLMEPKYLRTRILLWTKEEIELGHLPQASLQILEAILYQGEISRGEIANILSVTDRHARRMTSQLIELGVLMSDSPKSALKLAFPATLAYRWMPGLFPS